MFFFKPLQNWHVPYVPDSALPRFCADTRGIVAEDEKGGLKAAVFLDSWTANSCMIHVYIKEPLVLKHGFASEVFTYIFITSGRSVVIGSTPSDNKRALKFNKHIGFNEKCILKDAYADGIDLVITEMRKEDCMWIEQDERRVVNG